MNRIQLIFCVETNRKSDTDFKYLTSALREFYQLGSNVKIECIYMDGRGNYCASKTEKRISVLTKQFQVSNRDSTSYTIYCLDCDRYDVNPEDRKFLAEAEQYCKRDKLRRFVWFCRDVEDVFLGRQVEDKKKTKEAENFQVRKMIRTIDPSKLEVDKFKPHCSNLCTVLDELLKRKTNS